MSVCVKIYFDQEVRRFHGELGSELNCTQAFFSRVREVLDHPLPGLEERGEPYGRYHVVYIDNEGDPISIATTEELHESVVSQEKRDLLKYYVKVKEQSKAQVIQKPRELFDVISMFGMLVDNLMTSHENLKIAVEKSRTEAKPSLSEIEKLRVDFEYSRDLLSNFVFCMRSIELPLRLKAYAESQMEQLQSVILASSTMAANLTMASKFQKFAEKKEKLIQKTYTKSLRLELMKEKIERVRLQNEFKAEMQAAKKSFKKVLKDSKTRSKEGKRNKRAITEEMRTDASEICPPQLVAVSEVIPTAPPSPNLEAPIPAKVSDEKEVIPDDSNLVAEEEYSFDETDEEEQYAEELDRLVSFGVTDLDKAREYLQQYKGDIIKVCSLLYDDLLSA